MDLFRKKKKEEVKEEVIKDNSSYVASLLREYKLIEEEFYIETYKLIRESQIKQYEEKEKQKTK